MTTRTMRKCLSWFSNEMLLKLLLPDNVRKRSWRETSIDFLVVRLKEETEELERAIANGETHKVIEEAADVANFAMMVADLVRFVDSEDVKSISPMPSMR